MPQEAPSAHLIPDKEMDLDLLDPLAALLVDMPVDIGGE